MSWIVAFAESATLSDRFVGNPHHVALLAAGLIGEAGGILSEHKKKERDQESYTAFGAHLSEEVGDFLWYYTRLVTVLDPNLLRSLDDCSSVAANQTSLEAALALVSAASLLLPAVLIGAKEGAVRPLFHSLWDAVCRLAVCDRISLEEAASGNSVKTRSRWPAKRVYALPFDQSFPLQEQLPRQLGIRFRERESGPQVAVELARRGAAGIETPIGSSLTDNIRDPDGYRFHDAFHLAYAACLGWSPVLRALLHCKRKSVPAVDEAEDGARAAIIEEAISTIIFSRGKHLNMFAGISRVDYDLLKTVSQVVQGYEVESIPLWQWEDAILQGYAVFRQLRVNRGGLVELDLNRHSITYARD